MTDCTTHPFSPFFETFSAPFGETLKLRSCKIDIFAELTEKRSLRILYKIMPRHELFLHSNASSQVATPLSLTYQGGVYGADNWKQLATLLKRTRGLNFPEDLLALLWQVGGHGDYKGHFKLYGM